MFADFLASLFWYALAGLILVGLIRNRFAFSPRIRELGEAAANNKCVSFWPTIAALGLTALAALPWPLLVGFISWRCAAAGNSEILKALSHGLYCVAAGYFPLDFLRLACKPSGLAEAHFGWTSHAVKVVRNTTRAFTVIGLPLVLVTSMLGSPSSLLGGETFGRVSFIAITIALSYFASRVFHPQRGVLREYSVMRPDSWIKRLQPIWFWLVVLSPLMLSGLAFFGYYYTAQQLAWRLFASVCLLGIVVLATAVFSPSAVGAEAETSDIAGETAT